MGHCVRAIIGAHKDIQRIENDWFAKEIKLSQGYGMIFLTEALLDNIGELFESANEPSDPETVTSFLLQEYSCKRKLVTVSGSEGSFADSNNSPILSNSASVRKIIPYPWDSLISFANQSFSIR